MPNDPDPCLHLEAVNEGLRMVRQGGVSFRVQQASQPGSLEGQSEEEVVLLAAPEIREEAIAVGIGPTIPREDSNPVGCSLHFREICGIVGGRRGRASGGGCPWSRAGHLLASRLRRTSVTAGISASGSPRCRAPNDSRSTGYGTCPLRATKRHWTSSSGTRHSPVQELTRASISLIDAKISSNDGTAPKIIPAIAL